MDSPLWKTCVSQLGMEIDQGLMVKWISPLQIQEDTQSIRLLAPNPFVLNVVKQKYLPRIKELIAVNDDGPERTVTCTVGSGSSTSPTKVSRPKPGDAAPKKPTDSGRPTPSGVDIALPKTTKTPITVEELPFVSNLDPKQTFDTYVAGASNQIGVAAGKHVAKYTGQKEYNPLVLHGGVGLGKTHLMHAVGNAIIARDPSAKVLFVTAETYVREFVESFANGRVGPERFKAKYRSVDVLLIDDVQFFAGKESSQEELFHNYNALMEGNKQMIFTCDSYPKEVKGLQSRLTSRMGSGLDVCIEPPDLETRVAILHSKAAQTNSELTDNVAFFIANHVRSNVRELEGVLSKIIHHCRFKNESININNARDAMKDHISAQTKLVSVDSIQRMVCDYYKLSIKDMQSKSRARLVARPRQIAMALTKELTTRSLPEIGKAFGGRDHTTVLHACRKIEELRKESAEFEDEYATLRRNLEG